MSSRNGFIVIIKGKTCPACRAFNPFIPRLRKSLEEMDVKVLEFEVEKMFSPPNGAYPDSLGHIGIWYPFIFYANNNTWDAIVKGEDMRAHIKIFGGVFNLRSGYQLKDGGYNFLREGDIVRWLKDIKGEPVMIDQSISSENSLQVIFNKSPPKLNNPTIPKKPSPPEENKINKPKIIPRRKFGS